MAHDVILGTKLSVKQLYEILPPEMQAMVSVTTERNPRRFNGYKITACYIDEYKETI